MALKRKKGGARGRKVVDNESPAGAVWIAAGVFAVALFVRLVYLYQMSSSPTFLLPIIDSDVYDVLARTLMNDEPMSSEFFWQPFFYPFFLSKVYKLCAGSILWAKVLQMFLGAFTCVLVYEIGTKIAGRKVGLLAAIITTFYGPLVFFNGELLATGWAAFWAAAIVLAFIKLREEKRVIFCFVFGVIAGLSVITRPTFLPFVSLSGIWFLFLLRWDKILWKRSAGKIAVMLAGFVLVTGAVAVQNLATTGNLSFLPQSGPINLYIGNNPDTPRMLDVRPSDWKDITKLPRRYGSKNKEQDLLFFKREFRKYVATNPLGYVRGLAQKTLEFVSSREMARNINMYVFRKYSPLLSVLVWKVSGFGFPFGLLMPLAVVGLIARWRHIPPVIIAFLILYPLSVILIFVSARYRTPIVPIMAVPAAMGFLVIVESVRSRNFIRLSLISAAIVALILLSSIPGPFVGESTNYEAEMHLILGIRQMELSQFGDAEQNLAKAIKADPTCKNAYSTMGLLLGRRGEYAQAFKYHQKALEIDPYYPKSYNNYGLTRAVNGEYEKAIDLYRRAIEIDPYYDKPYYNWGMCLAAQGKKAQAVELYKRVLNLMPREDIMRNLAWLLATYSDDKVRDGDQAVYFAKMLCNSSEYKDPGHMFVLAVAYAEAGRFDDAVRTAEKALATVSFKTDKRVYEHLVYALQLFKNGKRFQAKGPVWFDD
jgi:Tfp pilus assembly protein PilF